MSPTQIQSGFIEDNVVTTAQIASGAVTTAKIASGAVTTAKLDSTVSGALVPIGGIIMWSGSVAAARALAGWALCDGAPGSGTPDLRNKFIVAAVSDTGNYAWDATTGAVTGNYAPGNSGGEAAHQLTTAELASHTHTLDTRDSTANDGTGAGANQEFAGWDGGPDRGAVVTQSKGGDNYHENRPPYYALAFIMRVS
jgi:microcystin-dependent protein